MANEKEFIKQILDNRNDFSLVRSVVSDWVCFLNGKINTMQQVQPYDPKISHTVQYDKFKMYMHQRDVLMNKSKLVNAIFNYPYSQLIELFEKITNFDLIYDALFKEISSFDPSLRNSFLKSRYYSPKSRYPREYQFGQEEKKYKYVPEKMIIKRVPTVSFKTKLITDLPVDDQIKLSHLTKKPIMKVLLNRSFFEPGFISHMHDYMWGFPTKTWFEKYYTSRPFVSFSYAYLTRKKEIVVETEDMYMTIFPHRKIIKPSGDDREGVVLGVYGKTVSVPLSETKEIPYTKSQLKEMFMYYFANFSDADTTFNELYDMYDQGEEDEGIHDLLDHVVNVLVYNTKDIIKGKTIHQIRIANNMLTSNHLFFVLTDEDFLAEYYYHPDYAKYKNDIYIRMNALKHIVMQDITSFLKKKLLKVKPRMVKKVDIENKPNYDLYGKYSILLKDYTVKHVKDVVDKSPLVEIILFQYNS